MIELIVLGVSSLFFYENADYFSVAKKQYEEGYHLEYVGITEANDEVISIPVKAPNKKEYIMFRMKY